MYTHFEKEDCEMTFTAHKGTLNTWKAVLIAHEYDAIHSTHEYVIVGS